MNTDYYDFYVDKNLSGEDLSFDEALRLFELPLPTLGRIADELRRKRCGELVTFVIDRNISYTNRCVSKCKFCAFYAKQEQESYRLSKHAILSKIKEAVDTGGATQILIQGGLDPSIGLEWFEDLFATIKHQFPQVHIHSLSPPEIFFIATNEGMSIEDTIARLRAAGLDSLPGGGAEILSDRIRQLISPGKVSADGWLKVMDIAQGMGMKTTATMMFGHIERDEDIIEHLLRVLELQNRRHGFTAFIPWTFQPWHTQLYPEIRAPAPVTRYLQVLAISRIVLHSIRNIQASWLTQGIETAKLALFFGANDFGGTILEEKVVTAAGRAHKPKKAEEIVKAIRSVGRPVAQRNTYYEILKYYG